MSAAKRPKPSVGLAIAVLMVSVISPASALGQRGGEPDPDAILPQTPFAVPLPGVSQPVTGPGTMYESVQSLPPGRDLAYFDYQADEYFVSGIALGRPYKTRIVVRKPENEADFSGLVLAEAMHPSGNAHLFEYASNYLMDSGHIAIEIVASGLDNLRDHNPERYRDVRVATDQISEVLAQVGAMLKSREPESPLFGLPLRKMILSGTSATAGILIRYLPGHMVYRTSDMERIYDGFLPHANGSTIRQVDVPLIQVPTMTEVISGNTTARPDGDSPGDQFRLYEFAGMAHIDTRDNIRHKPDPCMHPVSTFPLQAYVSVALHHLFRWVDEDVLPPRAPRIIVDRNIDNDGSVMVLDEHGNAVGGVRNPYVDVPTAKHGVRNQAGETLVSNPSAYIARTGQAGANQMCRLAGYEMGFSKDQLGALYDSPETYRDRVETRLDELEAAGWSLPVYREMILGDAATLDF